MTLRHRTADVHDRNFTKLAMTINADKMTTLHRGLHALGFLATHSTASLANAHHGRPVFFNLQTKWRLLKFYLFI